MSKKSFLAVFVFMALGLVLSACTCDAGSLLQPVLISPAWREVVDGSAITLEWSYPDTCEPEDFEIILSTDRDYSVITHTQLVSGDSTTWDPPTLDIAEQYWWRVRAKVGSTYSGYSAERRSFFTEPLCTAGELVMPSLTYPDFGGIFEVGYDSLEWSWPLTTCIPESYRVEVSMGSPAFTDTTYNGATGSPGTRWGFGSTPPSATQFWWRITPFSDGAYGPPSMAKMFWTDPICSGGSLLAPDTVSPVNNDLVTIANPIFSWTYPDTSCAPEGTHLWISDKPDMSSIVFDANNPTLAARAMQAGIMLDDCGEYYWQVAMVSEGTEGPPSIKRRFVLDTGSGCECAPGSTTIPVLTSPGSYEILPDTNAHLTWYNPGGCFPDGAAVQIATDHDFADMNEFTFPGTFVYAYDPPSLDPATQYRWKAAYYMDDAGSPVIGDYSGPSSFFTGPECGSLAEVGAPIRLAPVDGSTVNTLNPALKFTPGSPGCIPDGYSLHLHMLEDMSDPNLLTDYTFPATTVLVTPDLSNCQWYYWKVGAIQDGGYGPYSDVGSFYVDVDGTCLLPGMPATALINNYCRIGTFPEHHPAVYTFKAGEYALAIARNPFNTYLQLLVVDPLTLQPMKEYKACWSVWQSFEPGWKPPDPLVSLPEPPESPPDQHKGEYDFRELPVEEPPPTPVPTKIPVPSCHENLSLEDCKAIGGKFNIKTNQCDCPPG